jgi:hypothetical protein
MRKHDDGFLPNDAALFVAPVACRGVRAIVAVAVAAAVVVWW